MIIRHKKLLHAFFSHSAHVNEFKREVSKKTLGDKYILAPCNQIMRDAAEKERQTFIRGVK